MSNKKEQAAKESATDGGVTMLPAGTDVEVFPLPSPPKETPLAKIFEAAADKGDLAGMKEVCQMIADTDFVPKDYQGKPGNIMIAADMGRGLGLPMIQSTHVIAVINGRPSIWGDGIPAIVLSRGGKFREQELLDENGAFVGYRCTAFRAGHEPVTQTFTMDDADKANLTNKQGPWKQYPKRMCQMRARAFASRDLFADWLQGMTLTEEAQDFVTIDVDTETGEVTNVTGGGKKSDDVLAEVTTKRAVDALVARYESAATIDDVRAIGEEVQQSAGFNDAALSVIRDAAVAAKKRIEELTTSAGIVADFNILIDEAASLVDLDSIEGDIANVSEDALTLQDRTILINAVLARRSTLNEE